MNRRPATYPATSWCTCGAAIWWGTTGNGRRIPLETHASTLGNVRVAGKASDGTPLVEVLARPRRAVQAQASLPGLDDVDDVEADGPLYLAHHASCPHASQYRRTGPDVDSVTLTGGSS